ncbi:MAG: hypothetical protein CNLJKLNK_00673 [Holosporales bacterium]
MRYKISLPFFIAGKLLAASSHQIDAKYEALHHHLRFETITEPFGNIETYNLYNIDDITAQGLRFDDLSIIKGLMPHPIFNKPVYIQSLEGAVKEKFLNLPNLPKDIKETKKNIKVYVFGFATEAFNKENPPLFIYATRNVEADDVVAPLSITDFDYTDSLTRYRQICSTVKCLKNPKMAAGPEIFSKLQALANIGIKEAQFNCGKMLYYAKGIPQDKQRAFHYYQLAADQGHLNAQFNCGNMLYCVKGIPQDKKRAFHYYQLAADQGEMICQFYCGNMLFYADEIPQDKQRAFHYYMLAANQGHMICQFYCGNMFSDGNLQDKQCAFHYYQLAADQGLKDDQIKCGFMLYHADDILQDKQCAFHYYQLAADQGLKDAQIKCGFMLYHADGILQDKQRAFHYYQLAANQGIITAQFKCGSMLYYADGILQDKQRAFHYYQLAANQGMKEAKSMCKKITSSKKE